MSSQSDLIYVFIEKKEFMINLSFERLINTPLASLLIGGYSGLIFYLILKFLKSFVSDFKYLRKKSVSEEMEAKILIRNLKRASLIILVMIPLFILEGIRTLN
ncbi:MAG: hypothetical protein HC820_00050 [Hydrococcus sp. RM1_1_31]|nr:hypothetical protein [Hydrococcus sp. RM1_1_31]